MPCKPGSVVTRTDPSFLRSGEASSRSDEEVSADRFRGFHDPRSWGRNPKSSSSQTDPACSSPFSFEFLSRLFEHLFCASIHGFGECQYDSLDAFRRDDGPAAVRRIKEPWGRGGSTPALEDRGSDVEPHAMRGDATGPSTPSCAAATPESGAVRAWAGGAAALATYPRRPPAPDQRTRSSARRRATASPRVRARTCDGFARDDR